MKVKILTGHSEKEQEHRGLASCTQHSTASRGNGCGLGGHFFSPRLSSTLHQLAPQLGIRYTIELRLPDQQLTLLRSLQQHI